MFEHIANCHGEWSLLFSFLAGVPLLLPSVRRWLRGLAERFRRPSCPCGDAHQHGEDHGAS